MISLEQLNEVRIIWFVGGMLAMLTIDGVFEYFRQRRIERALRKLTPSEFRRLRETGLLQ